MRPRTPMGPALASMIALLSTLAATGPARAGSTTTIFTIQVDSDAAGLAAGPGGVVDFQLSPPVATSPPNVMAKVYNLQTDLTLGAPTTTGDASGQLGPGNSGSVTLDNATPSSPMTTNELYQTADLPTSSYFDVYVAITVTDPTATGASGTVFALSLYDGNPSDAPATATLTVQPDGTVIGVPSSITGAGVTITMVPEPSSLAMLGLGLGAIATAGRRRRAA